MSRRVRPRPPYPKHNVLGAVLVAINGLALAAMFAAFDAHSMHARALDQQTVDSCGAALASSVGLPTGVEPQYRLDDIKFVGPNEIRAPFVWTGSPQVLEGAPHSGVAHCVYSVPEFDSDRPLVAATAWEAR